MARHTVGAASSIPQFNIVDVNNALIKFLWGEDSFEELYCAPDFATGGILVTLAQNHDYVAVYRMSLGERVKEEERFVAYVAATRARKRLIWCYWNSGRKKRKPQIISWEN